MQAHFPEFTVYPGVFLLELALQAVASELGLGTTVATGVTHVRSMRFVAPFVLGDTVELEALVTQRGDGLEVDARYAHAGGEDDDDNGARGEAARIRLALHPRTESGPAGGARVSDA